MSAEVMLPWGLIHAVLQSNWFPSGVHQLFLLLQVAQTLEGSGCLSRITLNRTKVSLLWLLQHLLCKAPAFQSKQTVRETWLNTSVPAHIFLRLDMCVIGTTQRTCKNVNYRKYADTYGPLYVCVEVSLMFCAVPCSEESVYLKLGGLFNYV